MYEPASSVVPKGYLSSQTSVHFMSYHFVWCPKYRREVLIGKVETRLKVLLAEKTAALGCKILALDVMSDHVHIFVQANPTIVPNRIVAALSQRLHLPRAQERIPRTQTQTSDPMDSQLLCFNAWKHHRRFHEELYRGAERHLITYKFRIYPTVSREKVLNDTLETCRRLYKTLLQTGCKITLDSTTKRKLWFKGRNKTST